MARSASAVQSGSPSLDLLSAAARQAESNVTLIWRQPKKPWINPRWALAAVAGFSILIAAAWSVRAASRWLGRLQQARESAALTPRVEVPAPSPSRPTWLPDAALHAQLGDEVGLQQYRLRIPRKLISFPVRQPAWLPEAGHYIATSWMKQPEKDAMVLCSVLKYPSAELCGDDLEAALERFYGRMRRNASASNFSAKRSEIGYLAGKRFVKAKFSGSIKFDQDLRRVDCGGEVLINLEGDTEFTVYYLCGSDSSRELYLQLEASLLTLRTSGPTLEEAAE
jgi:hypothetical protein